jgi:hypothetical protein
VNHANRLRASLVSISISPGTVRIPHLETTIDIQPAALHHSPKQANHHGRRRSNNSDNSRENERIAHVERRMRKGIRFERILDKNKARAEQLPAGPADGAPDLR